MLKLTNVSAGYGKKTIITNISIEIDSDEIVAVIGLNGSGKSTLLRTCLGLLKPKTGEVRLEGESLEKISFKKRAQYLSLLESQSQVLFSVTVKELLEIATRDQNINLSEDALDAVGLGHFKNRNILELSTGERRRAFIAHSLAAHSKMIMIDEPFSHLDWSHQGELLENLKLWKKKHQTTFMLAIHELERALQLSDRIAVMKGGRLLKIDTAKNIFKSPEVFETFAFQAAIDENPLDRTLRLTLGKRQLDHGKK